MVTVAAQMMELPVGAGAAATTGKADSAVVDPTQAVEASQTELLVTLVTRASLLVTRALLAARSCL